jgi:ABC-type Fe3+/spermidine/putrescine transport system ATPase subunit
VYESPATVFVADFLGVSNLMDADALRVLAPAVGAQSEDSGQQSPSAVTVNAGH